MLRPMSEEVDGTIGFLVDIVKIACPYQYCLINKTSIFCFF